MALTLTQLIKISNLSPDVKKDALDNMDRFNETQKFQMSRACWESIQDEYKNKANLEYNRMLEEMANGGKKYGPSDFAAIDDKVLTDLLSRIDFVETKEELSKVKKELSQYAKVKK